MRTAKTRTSPLFMPSPSRNSSSVSPMQPFIRTNIHYISGTEHKQSQMHMQCQKQGNWPWWFSRSPWVKTPQRSLLLIFLHVSHTISTQKLGHQPSERNYTICPTVQVQRETCTKSRWYFITTFKVPWSLQLASFHCLGRGVPPYMNTFPHIPTTVPIYHPTQAGSCH